MRSAVRFVAIGSLVCASVIAPARSTRADPQPHITYVVNPEIAVPGNGAVLIATTVHSEEAPTVTVSPSGAPGTLIEGELVRRSSGLWAWLALTPLAPGSYEVTTKAASGSGDEPVALSTITVSPVFPIEKPELFVDASLGQGPEEYGGDCCSGQQALGIEPNCAYSIRNHNAEMSIHVESTAPPELLHQFLLGIAPAGATSKEIYVGVTALPQDATLTFREQAAEYCFEVFVIDLTTGEVHGYADELWQCQPHGDVGPIGPEVLEIPDAFFDRTDCPMPPYPWSERWCELNQSGCEGLSSSDIDEAGCRYYDHACHAGPNPDLPATVEGGSMSTPPVSGGTGGASSPDSGTIEAPEPAGGSAGNGGSGGAAGMQSGSDEVPDAAPAPRSSASGCGCAAARASGASPALGALAILLALIALRRRRSTTR